MDNAFANFNSIKQPSPNIIGQSVAVQNQNNSSENKQRKYNSPYLGAIDVPEISKTPLYDTMTINQRKNPKPKVKFVKKISKGFNFQNALSLTIFASSLVALFRLIKK